MIFRMQQLIKIIQKLFNLELYEDLCLFVELNLPTEPSKMFMDCGNIYWIWTNIYIYIIKDELDDDQRGYILYCLAHSYAQLNHFPQAIRVKYIKQWLILIKFT